MHWETIGIVWADLTVWKMDYWEETEDAGEKITDLDHCMGKRQCQSLGLG